MLEYKDLANHAQGEEKQKYLEQVQIEDINQMTMKILINSLYGALGNAMFVLFNETIARSITAMGRWTIILTSNNVQEYIQKLFKTEREIVIYNDTDSAYLNAEPIVDYFKTNRELSHDDIVNLLDNFYKKRIDPVVQDTIDQLARYTNAFQPEVQGADREVIGKAIFVAKKKYTMLVSDNEGVRYTEDSPYFKAQGLELIKGGTPDFSKKYLKEAIPVLMNKTESEIKEWFKQIKQDFMFWELDQIAKTQGVSKIYDPDWGKVINNRKVSIPFGSRTAIVSNKYIKENNLTDKFQLIQPGDKVKMLYLREPNPLNSDAFAFLEKDFAVLFREYIDYDKNFEKFFLAPLEIMTEALGINMKNNTEELDEW
jgi:DNA polymerase elongation subunit (family B)